MAADTIQEIFVGNWSYRSFNNDPDLSVSFDDLKFGQGTIVIEPAAPNELTGTIGGPGWSLDLYGSISYGNPNTVNFWGTGVVGGNEWKYAYIGYLAPIWPNGIKQVPAMVGTIVRVIPHPGSDGGIHPAGVVASWYALKQND